MIVKLLFASTCLSSIAGGAEHVAWEIAKRLVDKFELRMLTTGDYGEHIKEGITIHYIPRFPLMTLFYSSIIRRMVKRVLSAIRPDVVCFLPSP